MKKTPLRKVSKHLAKELRIYNRLRKKFLFAHPYCEAGLTGCLFYATEIHHMRGRGKLLNEKKWWLPACASCHRWITDNKKQAKMKGLTL